MKQLSTSGAQLAEERDGATAQLRRTAEALAGCQAELESAQALGGELGSKVDTLTQQREDFKSALQELAARERAEQDSLIQRAQVRIVLYLRVQFGFPDRSWSVTHELTTTSPFSSCPELGKQCTLPRAFVPNCCYHC